MNQRIASELPNRVSEQVRETGLLGGEKPILIMFSGGGDSVALLQAAIEICGAKRLIAFHVNYRLRGIEADGDEAFCRSFCADRGVRLVVESAPQGFADDAGNLQERARELRYSMAREVAAREGCSAIAVAHTADDQAETVLYRLFASPGRRALAGMAASSGEIVRPLLGLRRAELREWLKALGIDWREDASNADPRFARVRARGLLESAADLHPAAIENLLATSAALREEGEALDVIVSELTADACGDEGLKGEALAGLPPALARLVLRDYLEQAAGRPLPDAGARLEEVVRLSAAGGSHEVQLAGARVQIEYGSISLASDSTAVLAPGELPIPGHLTFGAWDLSASQRQKLPHDLSMQRAHGQATRQESAWESEVSAGGVLTVRSRRPGDRMRPKGLGGTKSLQDLFVDRKVPRRLRDSHPVVCSGDEIVWVPGVAIAEQSDAPTAHLTATRLNSSAP